jgi:hypothetical protein
MSDNPYIAKPPPAPRWICPYCGEPIGFLRNLWAKIAGVSAHGCTLSRWDNALQGWYRRQDEARRRHEAEDAYDRGMRELFSAREEDAL